MAPRSTQKPGLADSRLIAFLAGGLGMILIVAPVVTGGSLPGDLLDGRFNNYVLEHVYLWVTLQVPDFWNAPFFYPYQLTIAFSDSHIGDSPVYVLARMAGVSREDAFGLWYAAGYALNFIAADYALVRLGYSRLAAALGAFLFTFGLPMTAQTIHAQLVYRFGVPFAVLGLMQARDRRSLRPLTLAAFWIVWQFYSSIYIGYFLVLLLAAVVLAQALCAKGGPVVGLRSWPRSAARAWTAQPRRSRLSFVAAMTVAVAAIAALLSPYVLAGHVYGFHRPWWEVASMLPRPASYLLSTNSRLWPSTGRWFADLPLPWEHALFLGIAPFVGGGTAVTLRWIGRTRFDRLVSPVALAWLMLVAGTLYLDGFSLYRPVAALPGADAIRAMTRIVLVMLFPAGIVVASSIDAILAARLAGWMRTGTVGAIAGLLVFEASFIQPATVSKQVLRERIDSIAALLPAHVPEAPILLLGPIQGPIDDERQLDAMLFAQERGWPTINGYSGNWPPFYVSPTDCRDGVADLTRGLEFFHRAAERAAMLKRILPLGYAVCPDPSAAAGSPSSSSP